MNNPKVDIIIEGNRYTDCWASVEYTKSATNLTNILHLKSTNFAVAKKKFITDKIAKDARSWDIGLNDTFLFYVNNKIITEGYIDEIELDRNSDGSQIDIIGRDITCDLVDCNFAESTFSGKEELKITLLAFIKKICKPFRITVEYDPLVYNEVEEEIVKITVDPGQNIIEIIMKECMQKGILPISLGGILYLTRGNGQSLPMSDIISDTSILNRKMVQSNMERYGHYFCYGQNVLREEMNITDATAVDGFYRDTIISNTGRYRPLVIIAEDRVTKKECEQRVKFEANIRAGNSRAVEYTVQGWTTVNGGELWDVLRTVQVKDNYLQIDEKMLISEVQFSLDPVEGYITKLRLVHKDTYSLKEAASLIKAGFDISTV